MIVINAMPIGRVRHPFARASALFESDWATATGTSTLALCDGTKWASPTGLSSCVVVAAPTTDPFSLGSGYTFPGGMTNVLRVIHHDNGSSGCNAAAVYVSTIAAQSVGETRYYRVYHRVDYADDEGNFEGNLNSHHPIQNNQGETNTGCWNVLWASKATGTYAYKFAPLDAAFPLSRWIPCNSAKVQQYLTKGKVYRYEWALTCTGTNLYSLDHRIYDSAGTLLFNADGVGTSPAGNAFRDASSNLTMAATATGLAITTSQQRWLYVGTNGSNMRATLRDEFSYWGGVMVRNDDWCGAY